MVCAQCTRTVNNSPCQMACLTRKGLTGVPFGHSNILFFIFRYINVLYTIYIYYSVMTMMISNQHLCIYPQTHATHKQEPNRTTLSLSLSLFLFLSLSLFRSLSLRLQSWRQCFCCAFSLSLSLSLYR